MKKILAIMMLMCAGVAIAAGTVAVKTVEAHQRYPWNGLVDVVVTIQGSANDVSEAKWSFVATNSATKAAVPVVSIAQNGSDVGSGTTWMRRFIWNIAADIGAVKIDDIALTVDAIPLGGVQLWENGPYWAECNVGATKPEEYGYYFWWGDTVGYKRNASNNGWISVKNGASFEFGYGNCPTCGKNNAELRSAGYIDATGNLVAAHDAATAHLGAPWRMPTTSEIDALNNNCDWQWTTRSGVYGCLVTGRGAYASKSIFLPAAGDGYGSYPYGAGSEGFYWLSTPASGIRCSTCFLSFGSCYFDWNDNSRYYGFSVRPVRGFAQ